MVRILYFIVALIIVIMAFFYMWLRTEQVRYGYLISQRYEHLLELRRTNEKLKLEWSLLTSPTNLQEIAQKEFSMRPPKLQEIIFVPIPSDLFRNSESTETESYYNLEPTCS
ncbi:MAG: cell division protein FtsL [Syntrophobacterales bacterium]|nr:cell division protein FtsL [Syntrophobacterales bacterium]